MKKLEHPDSLHLEAAQGWLGLGNHIEADKELDEITPEQRAHPDVLEVRWHIYAKENEWQACADIATAITKRAPKRSFGWIHHSFALHRLERTQEAFDKLAPVADKFPKEWLIPYNLACYCAQLGRLDECEAWFKKAMALNKHAVQRAAIHDPDLTPLWDSMSGTLWKRIG